MFHVKRAWVIINVIIKNGLAVLGMTASPARIVRLIFENSVSRETLIKVYFVFGFK